MNKFPLILLLLAAFLDPGCKAKKLYPAPDLGWHTANYSVVFGRLQRFPSKDPDEPTLWLIRYDVGKDPHRGEFALLPADKLNGYSGGEMVEIHGTLLPASPTQPAAAGYSGSWYEIRAIRLWTGYKGQ